MSARLFCDLRVESGELVPPRGGLILAANHVSYLDPVLLGLAFPREIHFLAKRELFQVPGFGPLIRAYNAIPVDRGSLDRPLLRSLVDLLRGGGVLLMFPEGTRSRSGELGEARPGVGLIAREAGVPVIPGHIAGTFRWWRRAPWRRGVRVRFGRPIPPPPANASREESRSMGDKIMQAIGRLAGEGISGPDPDPHPNRGNN